MDPVKFLEFKNNEDKCRSTASNTVPIACANCGSNDYNIQTLQQANYLTPLHPGMPSFKLTSDSFKDNFSINPHLFSRPFFQPVFHNSSILSNPFYAHNNIGMMLPNPYRHLSEEQTQEKCESNTKATQVSNFSDYILNQTHQMPTSNDQMNFNKIQPKDNNAGGDNITKDLEEECHSKKSEESDTNYPPQCVCNNPTPWLYSPFILPIISYYILWNSQCSNTKLPPANYSSNHSQMTQTIKEDDEIKVSETSFKEEKDEADFNEPKEKLPRKSKDGTSEDFWTTDDKIPKNEWKIYNQKNGSSSSFCSISSLDYGEDIFFYTKRKSEAKIMSNNCGSEIGVGKSNVGTSPDEHKETEESAVKCETNESNTNEAEVDEKAYPSAPLSADIEEGEEEEEEEAEEEEEENEDENENNENNDDVDEDDVKYVNTTNEESLITEQASDLKIRDGFERELESMSSEVQFNAVDVPSEDKIATLSSKSSQEKVKDTEDRKPMSDYSESMLKDRVTYKKMIKNFTMADETNSKFYEESKTLTSMAAGGDLGGEHCVGYKIEISPPPPTPRQRGNVQNLYKEENKLETDEILLKDSEKELTDDSNKNNTDTKKSFEGGESENKSTAKIKPGRNFKSGIAKLSSNFKATCIESNTKNPKVKNCPPEMPKIRRKHNCMATVRTTENNEGNSKIQKSKYSRERQGKNLDSARENVPPNKIQKHAQSTKSTDSRQKRKDQQVRAPCKSSI